MRQRGTLILTLLVCLAGAYVWFERARSPEAPGDTGEPRVPGLGTPAPVSLLQVDASQVTAMRLAQGGTTRSVVRSGGTWDPPRAKGFVEDFLRSLTSLPILHDIPAAPDELREFGLDPPHGSVEVDATGHVDPLVLQIGDRNPPGSCVYVRLGAHGRVVLAGALVLQDFDHTFSALGP